MTSITAYQNGVKLWLEEAFEVGPRPTSRERAARFLEEALELYQACGGEPGEVAEMSNYVFNRPVGEVAQEVGGVMVTLAGLCAVKDVDLNMAAVLELNRVNNPNVLAAIRAKRAARVVPGSA